MPRIHQHATARRDLVEHFVYLAENAGLVTAERFLTSAEASFNDLAGQPMILKTAIGTYCECLKY